MKAIGNVVAMVGAVAVMGWLMAAQAGYQQRLAGNAIIPQTASADMSSVAAPWVDHETVVMK